MANRRVLINGLHLYLSPVLEGETFQEGTVLSVDGKPLPDKWVETDWHSIGVGSRVEFIYHVCFRLSGVVAEFNWSQSGGEVPFIRLVEGDFEGTLKELERGSLGRYGAFQVLSYEEAWVEPKWLFQGGISVSWSAYKSILEYLGDWAPFKPLSLAEVWQCVCYAADVYLEWSPENLFEALGKQGHFALPTELREIHSALRLADAIKEHGWPLDDEREEAQEERPEILNLWFDLESQRWIWLRPNSLFEDRLGLSCTSFTRQDLGTDVSSIAIKLLFPTMEPFFTVKGQVFTSVSGPA
jgi:hypothetical protein